MSKVWLITGASRGLGRAFTDEVLKAGQRVVATARNSEQLAEVASRFGENVRTVSLDVTKEAQAKYAVAAAMQTFGGLDVLVNNAGYGNVCPVEDMSLADFRAQIETNLFGVIIMTKAVLPYFRERGSGHIIQISSIGGVWTVPTGGLYHASKWGLEGFSQALADEVKGIGIKVTIIEPSGFATEFGTTSAHRAQQLPAYDAARASLANFRTTTKHGDPKATASALLRIVDAAEPPLRVFFGDAGLPLIQREYAERIGTWERWNDVSLEAQGNLAHR